MRAVKAAAVDTGIKAAGSPDGRKLRGAVIGGPCGRLGRGDLGGQLRDLPHRAQDGQLQARGGAIPLCMVGEFDLRGDHRPQGDQDEDDPLHRAVDVSQTLDDKDIGMCREVMDDFYAPSPSAPTHTASSRSSTPRPGGQTITIHYNDYEADAKVEVPKSARWTSSGADGANLNAKNIDAGEYDYAIAFQERIKIPDEKMDYKTSPRCTSATTSPPISTAGCSPSTITSPSAPVPS